MAGGNGGTENGERGTGNGERGTGNGERGTEGRMESDVQVNTIPCVKSGVVVLGTRYPVLGTGILEA